MGSILSLWKMVVIQITRYGYLRGGILSTKIGRKLGATGLKKRGNGFGTIWTGSGLWTLMCLYSTLHFMKPLLLQTGQDTGFLQNLSGRLRPNSLNGVLFGNGPLQPIHLIRATRKRKGLWENTIQNFC